MATVMECGVAPATRGWRLRGFWAARRTRARHRAEIARLQTMPDYLRKDIGLDGGLPPTGYENGGRTFVSHGLIDRTLSDWHW
ncbi:hypothetical protein [Paracoccus sp. MC1862]|uniref:hypothetical protein n=1 Tax=Paracoccus sp. MC1862 TaxID=2760307 RepID=UPI0015FF45B0|nr:hypothetical protein [Paracoccus sp. MC1862]MBB1497556.1 hypothetical protein [Paracoccus sp. MC1862]QQO44005.1 hypothetical protein JGR78_11390 [Paracoccus sp. MC1862]